jgi:hypothetical protein
MRSILKLTAAEPLSGCTMHNRLGLVPGVDGSCRIVLFGLTPRIFWLVLSRVLEDVVQCYLYSHLLPHFPGDV